MKLLDVKNLKVEFTTERGKIIAVDDISFSIAKGQTVAIVGESGCGKTVTALSLLQLISKPGEIVSGQILYNGNDLLKMSAAARRDIRGKKIAMIFQEPMSSLNPLLTIGEQIIETILVHDAKISRPEAKSKTIDLLQQVGIPSASSRISDYPHQFSGGQRQRIMIAMAISCQPDLLIADEPTTALDVTIQAQVLSLLHDLQEKNHMGLILITHDLSLVAESCKDVIVMYAGKIVEFANIQDIFYKTKHPYTRGLLNSIPYFQKRGEELKTIPGFLPDLLHLPTGCRFQDRCEKKQDKCKAQEPHLVSVDAARGYACYFPLNEITHE